MSPNWWRRALFLASLLGAYTALIAYLSMALWIWTYPGFYARPDPGMGGPHVYAGIVSVVLGLVVAAVTFLSAGLLRIFCGLCLRRPRRATRPCRSG